MTAARCALASIMILTDKVVARPDLPYLLNHVLRFIVQAQIDPTAMAANFQDKIILFGDSLTQRSWDPDCGGVGARLASTSNPVVVSYILVDYASSQICMCASSTL